MNDGTPASLLRRSLLAALLAPPDDRVTGEDCPGSAYARACGLIGGKELRCWSGAAGCGRPIYLDDVPRLASLVRGTPWA